MATTKSDAALDQIEMVEIQLKNAKEYENEYEIEKYSELLIKLKE